MKLIISGNGLDLHIGLKTSYRAYRNYLKNERFINGENAISLIEKSSFFLPRETDCWSDLENSLSFDFDRYIKECLQAYDRDINPNDEESCFSQIKAAQAFELQDPQSIARDFTNNWFWFWIARQYYEHIDAICETKREDILFDIIDKDSICVNFNYTHTLEDLTGLNKEQILYIHNRLPDKVEVQWNGFDFERDVLNPSRKQFQFGSVNNNFEKWEKVVDSIQLKSDGQLMSKSGLKQSIKEIYMAFSKNLSRNYGKLRDFIELYSKDISEVVVLGHSILGVDEPYYRDVIIPMLGDKKWTISYHNERDIDTAMKFSDKYNLFKPNYLEI